MAMRPHSALGTPERSAGVGSREAMQIVYRELLNPHHQATYRPSRFWFGLFLAAIFVPVLGGLLPVVGEAVSYLLWQLTPTGEGWLASAWPVLRPVLDGIVWVTLITVFITIFSMYAVWMERKESAHMQCRTGPMETGYIRPTIYFWGRRYTFNLWPKALSPHGWLQTLADGLKLMAKEDLIPRGADVGLFVLAPIIAFMGVFVAYVVLPFHGAHYGVAAGLDTAVYFVAAVTSIEAIGVVMAGWGSNNKWSLFGGIRAATQMVSYELPLGLSVLTVIVVTGTLSITEIVDMQYGASVASWNLFKSPFLFVAFLVYFVASLAECKRAPFDLPEAESELVSGFHTEYSSMRFSMFFLAEYASMYVVAAFATCLFLGGWWTGLPPLDAIQHEFQEFMLTHAGLGTAEALRTFGLGKLLCVASIGSVTLLSKAMVLIFFQMAARWTYPRLRLDQIMYFCLKVLLPIAMVVLVGATIWEAAARGNVFFGLLEGHTHSAEYVQELAAAGAGH